MHTVCTCNLLLLIVLLLLLLPLLLLTSRYGLASAAFLRNRISSYLTWVGRDGIPCRCTQQRRSRWKKVGGDAQMCRAPSPPRPVLSHRTYSRKWRPAGFGGRARDAKRCQYPSAMVPDLLLLLLLLLLRLLSLFALHPALFPARTGGDERGLASRGCCTAVESFPARPGPNGQRPSPDDARQ